MENIDIRDLTAQTDAYKRCLGISSQITGMPVEKLNAQKRADIIALRDVLIDSRELATKTSFDLSFIDDALDRVKVLLRGVR